MSSVSTSEALAQDAGALRITEIFYSLQGEARTVGCLLYTPDAADELT